MDPGPRRPQATGMRPPDSVCPTIDERPTRPRPVSPWLNRPAALAHHRSADRHPAAAPRPRPSDGPTAGHQAVPALSPTRWAPARWLPRRETHMDPGGRQPQATRMGSPRQRARPSSPSLRRGRSPFPLGSAVRRLSLHIGRLADLWRRHIDLAHRVRQLLGIEPCARFRPPAGRQLDGPLPGPAGQNTQRLAQV